MTTLSTRADIAENDTFQRRVRQVIVNAAIDVAAELESTDNHTARRLLAEQVLANPNGWAQVFAVGIAQNANVGTGISDPSVNDSDGDGALQFVANSMWNAYAAAPA